MTQETDFKEAQQHDDHKVPLKWSFRRVLAQLLATTVKNLILFDIGLLKAMVGIIIPALSHLQNEHNLNETLTITPDQATWLGSIGYITVPIGSVFSGPYADALGRRRAMLLINIPFIVSWFVMYHTESVIQLIMVYALLGFSVGLTEAPIVTYIGEICEPSLRGIMMAYSSFSVSLGSMFVFMLNTLMAWRTIAMVCMFAPILTIIGLLLVPETPIWLLSKDRTTEAEESLQWLRGWVSKPTVARELQELRRYRVRSLSCDSCISAEQKCPHPSPTLLEKIPELIKPQILKPFFILISTMAIGLFLGLPGMGPFIVQIFKAYDSPIPPDQAATMLNIDSNLGIAAFLILLRFTGKRPLYLTMLGVIIAVSAIISTYGFIMLPSGYNSFDHTKYVTLENDKLLTYIPFIPFICMFLWNFCCSCCVNSLGWQMMSELFPYKTRGLTVGITVALNYVLNFIVAKTYYNLETMLSLPGYTLYGCVVATLGWILMYKILPETEGRTLEDIELHFSDKTKKLTDRKIPKPKNIVPKNECHFNDTVVQRVQINGTNPTSLNPLEKQDGYDNCGFINTVKPANNGTCQ